MTDDTARIAHARSPATDRHRVSHRREGRATHVSHAVRHLSATPHPAVVSGRTAGTLFALCGLYTFVTILFPTPAGFQPWPVVLVAVSAVVIGLIALRLPWDRIPDLCRLSVGPGAMGLIAVHNIVAGMDAFRYGMFFFLVFIWAGLCEKRGTSIAMSPFLLAAYTLPLLADGASSSDLASLSYAIPLYLTVGEVLAWRSERLRRLQDRLQHLADHDPLTGLPNRAVFTAALGAACERPEPVAVLFLDLDGFKQINDRLGHAAGDEVLVKVAEVLRTAVRDSSGDLSCRLAGDEFVILLVDADLDAARAVADRLVRDLTGVHAVDGTPVRGSVGIAAGRDVPSQHIVAAADQAMYSAKRSGSGPVAVSLAPAA
jgi:diguanylate cyclase (GGDEF)-like protein